MRYLRLLFIPFSLLYALAIAMRNFLFKVGQIKSQSFLIPIISIGNITVGGTGKTPATEYIIRILQKRYRLATLSRGYKRKTKGVILSDDKSTAADIGDEPMQMKNKFKGVQVAVAEKRVDGISALLSLKNLPDVILMDDAFQHRYVLPGLSILLIDFNRPIWNDILLPAGNLREFVSGKKRADIILFSKCPSNISEEMRKEFTYRIQPTTNQNVYFSTVDYFPAKPLIKDNNNSSSLLINKETEILVISGIARPEAFISHVKKQTDQVHVLNFSDHHTFIEKDLVLIEKRYNKLNPEHRAIITTEKDATRLKELIGLSDALKNNIWYIPIQMKILFNQEEQFEKNIIKYVDNNRSNSKIYS
ncbi:tetraacyldisaccharide 4'-kinase [bacterium]|nr:tetraacyldisaccharide 4'-kinase [bacterium]